VAVIVVAVVKAIAWDGVRSIKSSEVEVEANRCPVQVNNKKLKRRSGDKVEKACLCSFAVYVSVTSITDVQARRITWPSSPTRVAFSLVE
jgi:hypothetical protein